MCAIFGSSDLSTFKTLYKHNICRGSAAFGGLFLDNTSFSCFKAPGIVDLDHQQVLGADSSLRNLSSFNYLLGHTQAPTSSAQQFDPSTTHPFFKSPWFCAHNGVLTNFDELKHRVSTGSHNIVDSSIIPALLHRYQQHITVDIDLILLVMEMLKGTYSLWLFNVETKRTFLVRCGSTLFADKLANNFSSTKFKEMEELEDGNIYQKTQEGLTHVATFKSNSPFFII